MSEGESFPRGEIRSVLLENLPWSPLDFLRPIDTAGDRAIFLDSLLGEIKQQDDLRFVHHSPEGELAIFAEKLPWDSAFFGFGVGRINAVIPLQAPFFRPHADYRDALHQTISRAKERDIRYLLAFVDARNLAVVRGLGELGFALIETRAYDWANVTQYADPRRMPFRLAEPKDLPSLAHAAITAVNPFDRFHSDPFLPKEAVDRMMYKLVEAALCEGFVDAVLVPDVPEPKALITIRYHKDHWDKWKLKMAQLTLGAVAPEASGVGRHLVIEANYHLKELGIEYVYYSTQVANQLLTYNMGRHGYTFGKAEHVFRIVI